METKWTVEYSSQQKCFHLDTLDYVLIRNFNSIFNERDGGYKIIGIFDSQDEGLKFIKDTKKLIKDKHE